MSETDGQYLEYNRLNEEIGRNSQVAQNVFVANVGVTAGLIGYGLDSGVGPIFLAPFAIIIPSLFFLASQLESTTRIAAYIYVFIESNDNGLNWEGRWLDMRKNDMLPSRRKYTLSLSGLYGMLSIVCILLAFRYWQADPWVLGVVIVPIALLVFVGVRMLIRAFSLQLCDAYVAAWKELAK